ncbi:MAG TPA: hypothetical protein PKI32_07285 [Opitutales bacterium]|nr:hypothetical protein [Opitutales bacterium]
MKKALAALLGVFLLAAGSLPAQNIGDAWTDRRGIVVQFAETHLLNLRIAENHLQMVFFDDKGLVEAPQFEKVIVRLDSRTRKGPDITCLLLPVGGSAAMESPRFVKPPYVYTAVILLYPKADSDEGRIVVPATVFRW